MQRRTELSLEEARAALNDAIAARDASSQAEEQEALRAREERRSRQHAEEELGALQARVQGLDRDLRLAGEEASLLRGMGAEGAAREEALREVVEQEVRARKEVQVALQDLNCAEAGLREELLGMRRELEGREGELREMTSQVMHSG